MPQPKPVDPFLRTLLRKRVEVYTWLDGPPKQAHLAAINRMIEQRRDEARAERITLPSGALVTARASRPRQRPALLRWLPVRSSGRRFSPRSS
jgi:hypothetical protein